jgi:acetyl-CoA C-acetyltransferase
MNDAFIVDAVRVPTGRRGGALSEVHPVDLGAHVLKALVERTGIPAEEVDDVIFGCVDQLGAQAANVARQSWLATGFSESVPGTTVERQCGSSQQAAQFAALGVMAGQQDLVIAGGVEVMSKVPINSSTSVGIEQGFGDPYSSEGLDARYGDVEVTQFNGAQLIAEKWDLDRTRLEEFALQSHQRAARAWEEGRFDSETVACAGLERDEGFRADVSLEKMASLPALPGYDRLTAAVASQISDGAAALLIASEDAVKRHGLRPRARFHTMTVVGSDPVLMLTGPIPATAKVLERASLRLEDIDLFEVNEAFAPIVLAWAAETGADLDKTNVNGGAIALGHPLGASGAKLTATLLNELERTGGRYGLQTMCEGGGMANATIIERL